MTHWAIVTGEYPPQPGGVADSTALVARGLADAGDAVTVFAPRCELIPTIAGVRVCRLPDHFGPRGLFALDAALARSRPDRILLQYVPHAYGWKGMNLPFACWVAARARRIAPLSVMFHEVTFPFSWRSARHAVLGSVTRVMARLVAGAAARVFVSVPAWADLLRRLCPRVRTPEWLPVPSNVACGAPPGDIAAARVRFAPDGESLVGHFGTFGRPVADLLTPALVSLLEHAPQVAVLLVGRGSEAYRAGLAAEHPGTVDRVRVAGELPADAVAAHLRACDLLIQPYPDGISSRRTSVMAGLANAVAVVTNVGVLSEPIWVEGAVAAASTPEPREIARLAAELLADADGRARLGARGTDLYRGRFGLEHTIARLRAPT